MLYHTTAYQRKSGIAGGCPRFGVRYRYRAGSGTDVLVQGLRRHWQFIEYPFDFLRKKRYNVEKKAA